MDFRDPTLYCLKCGAEIPRNGELVGGKRLKTPRIACERCAIQASKGLPSVAPQRRLRKGERAEGQASLLDDCSSIYLG